MKFFYSLVFLVSMLMLGCKQDTFTHESAKISVRMHDMPIDYDSLFVEVVGLKLHINAIGWIDLNVNSGVYDLLELQNGVDTLLVPTTEIPAGLITRLRLVLGTNNSVYVSGNQFPLPINSQDESGLKVDVNEYLESGDDVVLTIDFDALQSLHITGNGTYRLRPVLKASVQ